MKKMLCMILALVMVFSMSISAMAADSITPADGDSRKEVTATYVEEGEAIVEDTYAVTIAWSVESSLKYSEGTKTYTWIVADDTATSDVNEALTWKETEDGKGWTGSASISVTITNKSSQAVKASVADNAEVAGAAVVWTDYTSGTEQTIGSAAENIVNYSGTGKAQTLTLSGTISSRGITGTIAADGAKVATITVTLTK